MNASRQARDDCLLTSRTALLEADGKNDAFETLAEPLGWPPLHGEQVAHDTDERDTWDDVLMTFGLAPRYAGDRAE